MATGGSGIQFSSANERAEYNEKLYKAILLLFVNHMPAQQLIDLPQINDKLTQEDMQRVRKKFETESDNGAARLLLELLKMKYGWFEALMEALEVPDLKIHEFKDLFLEEKKRVDREWMRSHPQRSVEPMSMYNRSMASELRAPRQVNMDTDQDTVRMSVPSAAPVLVSTVGRVLETASACVNTSPGEVLVNNFNLPQRYLGQVDREWVGSHPQESNTLNETLRMNGGSGIQFSSAEERTEYNEKLYKAILPLFVNHMPAQQLMDLPQISHKLTQEDMERVRRKDETAGNTNAAKLLLELLKVKSHWFDALMEALDIPDLKLHEFKPQFLAKKIQVDREWMCDQGSCETLDWRWS